MDASKLINQDEIDIFKSKKVPLHDIVKGQDKYKKYTEAAEKVAKRQAQMIKYNDGTMRMPKLDAEEMKEINEMLKEAEEIMDEFEQKAAIRAKEMGEDKKAESGPAQDALVEDQKESTNGQRTNHLYEEEKKQ